MVGTYHWEYLSFVSRASLDWPIILQSWTCVILAPCTTMMPCAILIVMSLSPAIFFSGLLMIVSCRLLTYWIGSCYVNTKENREA